MPSFDGLQPLDERHLGRLLLQARRGVDQAFRAALAPLGFGDVRVSHYSVFRSIDATGTRVSTLADRAGVTRQAMSQMVTDLAGRGYLALSRDPADGRAVIVRLTGAGRRFYDTATRVGRELEADWAKAIGPGRFRALRIGLIALIEHHDAPRVAPTARAGRP